MLEYETDVNEATVDDLSLSLHHLVTYGARLQIQDLVIKSRSSEQTQTVQCRKAHSQDRVSGMVPEH